MKIFNTIESNENNIEETKELSHYVCPEEPIINNRRINVFSRMNARVSNYLKKLKMRIMNKKAKMQNAEKFDENVLKSNQIKFNLFEGLKLVLKRIFKMKKRNYFKRRTNL